MVETRQSQNEPKTKNTQVLLDVIELETIIAKAVNDKIQPLLLQVIELKQTVKDLRDTNLELISICTRNPSLVTKNTNTLASYSNVTQKESADLNESLKSLIPDNTKLEETLKFTKTTHKVNNNRNNGKNLKQPKSQPALSKLSHSQTRVVHGASADIHELTPATKKLWIYVGKLHPSTTTEVLQKFLLKKLPNRVFQVDQLRASNSSTSFRIAADLDIEETLYSDNFWPQGVLVKRFIFFRRRQINGNKTSSQNEL